MSNNNLKDKSICFFISSPHIGGVESIFINYANRMASLGYNVKCVICQNGSLGSLFANEVKVINLKVSHLRGSLIKLCLAVRKYKIDIMICSNVQAVMPLMAKYLCRHSMRIVSSHHFYCNNSETNYIKRAPLRIVYNLSDVVFAVSEGIKMELINTIGINPSKVCVIDNPVDVSLILQRSEEYKPANASLPNITWVGRFSVVKNLPLLINAFCEFWKSHPDFHLFLVGGGAEMTNIKNLIQSKDCSEFIHLEGIITNPMPYIKYASIIALCSTSEAQSVFLREALALGKNIVATPTDGAKETLAYGKYGYIAESFEIDDILKGFNQMINHQVDRDAMNDWIMKFDAKVITNRLINMLSSLN